MRIVTVVGAVDTVDNTLRTLYVGALARFIPGVGLIPLLVLSFSVERIGRK